MREKQKLNERGITLTSLVVTIIVMLILAGVTISIINNTGILKNSQSAADQYEISDEQDVISVAFSTVFANNALNDTEITAEMLQKELDKTTRKTTVRAVSDTGKENLLYVKFDKTKNEHAINIENGQIEYVGPYSEVTVDILKAGIIHMSANPLTYTNGNVTVTITYELPEEQKGEKDKIVLEYALQKSPTTWIQYETPLIIEENMKVYARLRYLTETTESLATLTVEKIDKLAPLAFTPTTSSTTNSITVTANTQDAPKTSQYACSGLAGYSFSKDGGKNWTEYQTSGTYVFDKLIQDTVYQILVKVKDIAGNEKICGKDKGETPIEVKTVKITGEIKFGNAEWNSTTANRAKLTITGSQSGCELQYQINSISGTWITITSGSYIPEVSSGTIVYARLWDGTNAGPSTNPYANITVIDNIKPSITLGTNSNTTWSQNASVVVTVTDNESMIPPTEQTLKYGWSTSNTTEPSTYQNVTLSNTTATRTTTFTASGPNTAQASLSGKYYLWVVPETLQDAAGNSQTGTVKSTGTFYIDNTKPVVSSVTATTNKITFTATDGIGITAYAVTTSNSAPSLTTTGGVEGNSGLGKWIPCTSTTSISNKTLTGYTQGTTYYVWVRDAAGNISASTTSSTTLIKGTITFGDVVWSIKESNKAQVTVNVNELQPGCSLQYRIGSTGEWRTITSGSYIQSEVPSGTVVYARIYDGTNEGPTGTASTTATSYANITIIDNIKPSITLGKNSNTTWSQNASVVVAVSDDESMIPVGQTLKYGWSTSNTTAPSTYQNVTLSNTTATGITTFTASGPNTAQASLSGKYYLWVVPVSLKDAAGNSQTGTVKSTGTFYIDNTKPVVSSVTATTNKITFTATDGIGITAYAVTTSNSAPSLTTTGGVEGNSGLGKWIVCTSTTSISNKTLTGYTQGTTYYVWVRDAAGNVSASKSVATTTMATPSSSNISYTTTWSSTGPTATVTFTTTSGFTIQVSTDGGNTWTTSNTATVTSGTTIYVRYSDGTNTTAKYAAVTPILTYTIAYNANNGTGTTASSLHNYGTAKALTANGFSRTGYTFNGWNTKADGTGTSYTNSQSVTNLSQVNGSTVTLYAQWKVNSYKLTVDPNGGKMALGNSSNYTENIQVIDYTFGVNLEFATTLNWTYKDTYGYYAPINVYCGGAGYVSETFQRTGYTFEGWKVVTGSGAITERQDSHSYYIGGGDYDSYSFKVWTFLNNSYAGDVTVQAQWTANTYTATLDANGGIVQGNSSFSTRYYYLQTWADEPVATRTGYTFDGWWTSTSGGSQVWQADGMPQLLNSTFWNAQGQWIYTSNVTLYARWTANTYTVSLTAGTGISAVYGAGTYNAGDWVTVSASLNSGYSFSGWTGTYTSTGQSYSFTMPAGNVSLTANASVNTYTVSYDANGGSGAPASQTKTYGVNLTLSSTIPTRSGYTFLGWSTSNSATTATYSAGGSYTSNSSTTLYAVWSVIANSTVTFKYGGTTVYTMTVTGTGEYELGIDMWDATNYDVQSYLRKYNNSDRENLCRYLSYLKGNAGKKLYSIESNNCYIEGDENDQTAELKSNGEDPTGKDNHTYYIWLLYIGTAGNYTINLN